MICCSGRCSETAALLRRVAAARPDNLRLITVSAARSVRGGGGDGAPGAEELLAVADACTSLTALELRRCACALLALASEAASAFLAI